MKADLNLLVVDIVRPEQEMTQRSLTTQTWAIIDTLMGTYSICFNEMDIDLDNLHFR